MAVPVITSISPTSGSEDGGTTVTIVGTNLGTPTAVTFSSTAAAAFVGESATRAYAISPAGTGAVSVTLTTAGGTSAAVAAATFTYGDALFSVAEARAFDKAQLTDSTTYANAAIIAKEAEIREWLERVCGVNFVATTHTDEYHDGDGTDEMLLDWPRVTSVTAASYRDYGTATWTALTETELACLQVSDTGLVTYEGGEFTKGVRNWKFTYVAGYTEVPDLVKRAALMIAVTEMPSTNVPFAADDYDAAGMSVSFGRGDGYNQAWHRIPDVVKAIRMYGHKVQGIA